MRDAPPAAIETNPLEYAEVAARSQRAVKCSACARLRLCRTDFACDRRRIAARKSPVIPATRCGHCREARGGHAAFAIGDRVGIGWLHRRMEPANIARQARKIFATPDVHGYSVNGGYAEYIVAPEDFIYALPAEFPMNNRAAALRRNHRFRSLRLSGSKQADDWLLWLRRSGARGDSVARHWNVEVFASTREFVTKNSRWSWARRGPEARMMNLRRSWTPIIFDRPEKSFRSSKALKKAARSFSANPHEPHSSFSYTCCIRSA